MSLAQALFSPRAVALVGASGEPGKHASLPQRYLKKHGFAGKIYPVNPTRQEIFGDPAFHSVQAIPGPVDHAFIMVRTASVLDAVRDCIAAGVPCATILTGGFAEAGEEGRALQQELRRAAEGRIRLVGPNSLGVINTRASLTLSANEVLENAPLAQGRTALISQSGSLIGALLSRGSARNVAFSTIVSVGNELDLGVGELGDMLVDDANTDVILLFLETIRNAAAIAAMARRAYAANKPVIAYTLGRSAIGQQLATSHTGALAGGGAAVAAFLRDNGIVHIDHFETLLEAAPLFATARPPVGKHVSVLSTTGGGAALVMDNLGLRGIDPVPPGAEVVTRLAAKGITIENAPLVDLTLTGTNAATYGAVLDEMLAAGAGDAVIAVVGSSSQSRPDRAVKPIVEAVGKSRKPIAAFLTPQADQSLRMLQEAGVAAFRTPEACADAVDALLRWQPPRRAPDVPAPSVAPDAWQDGAKVLAALAIPTPQSVRLRPDDLASIARLDIRFPVALKIVSPDIPHKTEAGGVALGIGSHAALKAAATDMLATVRERYPNARIEGLDVQTMETGLAEVLIGYRRDAQVGPTITVGSGGVLSELLRDVVTRVAPVSVDEAKEMIGQVRSLGVLRGYRSLPAGDIEALAKAISRLSSLALVTEGGLREAEINPVLVRREGEGIVALDVLLVPEA
jgi:acyl-CoA synthetase (NDP forming)